MKFHYFVCPHGYGHIKRDMAIAESILRKRPASEICFHVNENHFNSFNRFIKSWYPELNANRIFFEFGSMALAPDYIGNSDYKYVDYEEWIKSLSGLKIDSNVIILSDNIVGVLGAYPHATLIGSFLWRDIGRIRNTGQMDEILSFEDRLLEVHIPEMLGVKYLVMPEAVKRTNFVGFPWFCTRPEWSTNTALPRKTELTHNLLFTGGGTNIIHDRLCGLAAAFSKLNMFSISVDSGLYNILKENEMFDLFDYQYNSYSSLDFIIGRPGAGLLSDSVKYSTPLLMVYEEDNDEMRHNAEVFQKLGLGLDINKYSEPDFENMRQISDIFSDVSLRSKLKANLDKQPTGGIDLVAEYLIHRQND